MEKNNENTLSESQKTLVSHKIIEKIRTIEINTMQLLHSLHHFF